VFQEDSKKLLKECIEVTKRRKIKRKRWRRFHVVKTMKRLNKNNSRFQRC